MRKFELKKKLLNYYHNKKSQNLTKNKQLTKKFQTERTCR